MTYVWMGSEIPDMLHDQFWGYSRNLTKPKPGAQGQSNMQMKFQKFLGQERKNNIMPQPTREVHLYLEYCTQVLLAFLRKDNRTKKQGKMTSLMKRMEQLQCEERPKREAQKELNKHL